MHLNVHKQAYIHAHMCKFMPTHTHAHPGAHAIAPVKDEFC